MNIFVQFYLVLKDFYNGWIAYWWSGANKPAIASKSYTQSSSLTPKELQAVKETWAIVCLDPKGNSVQLFLNFFKDFPEYQKKFKGFAKVKYADLAKNARFKAHAFTVVNSIGGLVDNIEDLDMLSELLIAIGKNHKTRALSMGDFENLNASILGFFAMAFKDKWTREAKSGWEKVFSIMLMYIQQGLEH